MTTQAPRTIRVEVRNVYGKEAVYPICKDAKALAALTGKKTFSSFDLSLIRELGYEIVVIAPTLKF